jgi:hypothetical protein
VAEDYTPLPFLPLAIVVLLLLVFPAMVTAAEVRDLYAAEVTIASMGSTADRETAVREALAVVLVKVTGDRDVATRPGVAGMLAQASSYMEQFEYRKVALPVPESGAEKMLDDALLEAPSVNDFASEQMLTAEPTEPAEALHLRVVFDEMAVNRMLQQLALPIWGKTRPVVLVWLAVQEGMQRYLLDAELNSDLRDQVLEHAGLRGMPLVFPLMDLEDRANINISDVWGNFSDTIMSASGRYHTDVILVGRVHQAGDAIWRGRWALYQQDGTLNWETEGGTLDQVLAGGVDGGADYLARQYAQVLTTVASQEVVVNVAGVENLAQYARTLDYLESLNQIASLQVAEVSANDLYLRIAIRGTVEGLGKTIELGDVLELEPRSDQLPFVSPEPGLAETQEPRIKADIAYRLVQ